MKISNALDRVKNGVGSEEEIITIERVSECAKRCLNSSEGQILMQHLIDEFELDSQKGCLSPDESVYVDGKQDALKYILILLSE